MKLGRRFAIKKKIPRTSIAAETESGGTIWKRLPSRGS